jgi:hypothetical protein
MTWTANIADPKIEKHTLVVLKPRIRLTGWDLYSSGGGLFTYRTLLPLGFATRVWNEYANNEGYLSSMSLALVLINPSSWFFEQSTGYVYYTNIGAGNPDDNALPGLTVEFELHVSEQAFIGPRNPLNTDSEIVNWIPALTASPFAKTGDRSTLYGFLPISESGLELKNHDGWLNTILYKASFNHGRLNGFILANPDLKDGITYSEVRQVFTGYIKGVRSDDFNVSVDCADLLYFFDRELEIRDFSELVGTYTMDPDAIKTGAPWFIRRIFGMVPNLKPVNADWNAVPATNNNRKWITHQRDFEQDGVTGASDGQITYLTNGAGANSATRTYLQTVHDIQVDDSVVIQRSGVNRYALVTNFDRALKYIDHTAIAGAAIGSDVVTRGFLGKVVLVDENDLQTDLVVGVDVLPLVDDVLDVRGLILTDNFEASYPGMPTFDPTKHKLLVNTYGTKTLDKYADNSDVGAVSIYGGVKSLAVSILYRLLLDSGFAQEDIADSLFQDVQASSFSLGFSVPETREGTTIPKYTDLINQILGSNLYRLSITDTNDQLLLGITELKPYVGDAENSANELNHKGLTFQQAYDQVYSEIVVGFAKAEDVTPSQQSAGRGSTIYTRAESLVAKNLHFISARSTQDTLISNLVEAFTLATRLAFALGDRRGFWGSAFEITYLDRVNLGATYSLTRQFLPGSPYVEFTQRNITLVVAEVNKNSDGVNIVFEDQKGVQDNAADWGS